jgi:hypothetical protein
VLGDDTHYYGVPEDSTLTLIVDMRKGKRNLHFLVGEDVLLPFAVVKIPDVTLNFAVYY